jgi:hypothetical protein
VRTLDEDEPTSADFVENVLLCSSDIDVESQMHSFDMTLKRIDNDRHMILCILFGIEIVLRLFVVVDVVRLRDAQFTSSSLVLLCFLDGPPAGRLVKCSKDALATRLPGGWRCAHCNKIWTLHRTACIDCGQKKTIVNTSSLSLVGGVRLSSKAPSLARATSQAGVYEAQSLIAVRLAPPATDSSSSTAAAAAAPKKLKKAEARTAQVDAIVRRPRQYLVLLSGCSRGDAVWVDESQLVDCELLLDDLYSHLWFVDAIVRRNGPLNAAKLTYTVRWLGAFRVLNFVRWFFNSL